MNSPAAARHVDATATPELRQWAMFTHLAGLLSLLGSHIVGPIAVLIMWRIKAKDSPFADDHGREALNFQISLLIYFFGGGILLALATIVTLGLGAILTVPFGVLGFLALLALQIVGACLGAGAANRGEYYRYPMCLRLIKGPADAA
ncbi:MAG: DUF4870 domain-containing protein [Phycisphaerales bacterium]|nr:DUF4870 domain-containing protein [Phycisphaerales bacterium]